VATLPDPTMDPRGAQTALAVALGGAICPVPFVMSAAALRLAAPRASHAARIAHRVATATIVLQALGLVALVVVLVL
jgi:hypothetical protein